jgi:hypothetical protein
MSDIPAPRSSGASLGRVSPGQGQLRLTLSWIRLLVQLPLIAVPVGRQARPRRISLLIRRLIDWLHTTRRRTPSRPDTVTAAAERPLKQVIIYHNITTDDLGRATPRLCGYRPGHALVPVARWEVPVATPQRDVVDDAFLMLSGDYDPRFHLKRENAHYGHPTNRPITIGDVIQIADTWVALDVGRNTVISRPEYFAGSATCPGTTPMPAFTDL